MTNKKFFKAKYLAPAMLVAAFSFTGMQQTAYAKTDFTIIQEDSADHIKGYGINLLGELITEKMGDDFNVKIFHNGSLYDIEQGLDALQAGNIQMVVGSTSKLKGYDGGYQLYDLPFLFTTQDQFYDFYDSDLGQELNSKIEDKGLKILDTWAGTLSQLTNSKHEIKEPDDLKGLKFRVMAGGLLADQFTTLGAGASVIPFTELYMALDQGVVDGQENPFIEIANENLYEVQKYMTISNHKLSTYPLVVNKTFWDGLSKHQRETLTDIVAEVRSAVEDKLTEYDDNALNKIKDAGSMEIYTLTDEQQNEFKNALLPLYEKYQDDIGEKYIDAAKKLQ